MKKPLTAVLLALAFATPATAKDIAIHAGTLYDGASAAPRREVTILVHDDRIAEIKAGYVSPAGAEVVDLSGQTVMPGFIDCHVHISATLPGAQNDLEYTLSHNDIDRALDGAKFARELLLQGFTSARDVGGGDDTVSLRNAINDGKVPGPRLFVSLEPLSPTGGHGDQSTGIDRAISNPSWQNGIVDSPEEARRKVRDHKRRGADLIKIMPSGGISSTGDDPNRMLMADDEMKAAVETAHALGLKVAAHIYPAEAIKHAVMAGIDSVEHGSFADAEAYQLMKQHGTYLVPTLTIYDVAYKVAKEYPELLQPGTVPKELANDQKPIQNFPNAVKAGVKIALGTDEGQGDHAREFVLMTQATLPPSEALFAGTRNAADLIGASDRIGSIQPGRYADIVAVTGDPMKDPGEFEKVQFVMKGGTVYKTGGQPTGAVNQ